MITDAFNKPVSRKLDAVDQLLRPDVQMRVEGDGDTFNTADSDINVHVPIVMSFAELRQAAEMYVAMRQMEAVGSQASERITYYLVVGKGSSPLMAYFDWRGEMEKIAFSRGDVFWRTRPSFTSNEDFENGEPEWTFLTRFSIAGVSPTIASPSVGLTNIAREMAKS